MKNEKWKRPLLIVGIAVFGLLSAVLLAADILLLVALWQ